MRRWFREREGDRAFIERAFARTNTPSLIPVDVPLPLIAVDRVSGRAMWSTPKVLGRDAHRLSAAQGMRSTPEPRAR
jgi:hypothetical protein